MIDAFEKVLGAANVLQGSDTAPWSRDWTGAFEGAPEAVLRPRTTEEVAACVKIAHEAGRAITTVSGNTGLNGGAIAPGGLILSLDRMRDIRNINRTARTAEVQAGIVLSELHAAVAEEGMVFPVTFGAKGSCRIGGMIATNAGGSNVLRYGNTREQVLGLEAVMADGQVMNLMTALHKDNTGLDLKDLLIGSEGTLGIVTAAVLRLQPAPAAYATAMVGMASLSDALTMLRRLQDATGGAVEAYEFMPPVFLERYAAHSGTRLPFAEMHDVNILVEIATTIEAEATPGADGTVPLAARLEEELGRAIEDGLAQDAIVASSSAQRQAMWARREAAAELLFTGEPCLHTDVSLPLDQVEAFMTHVDPAVRAIDPGASDFTVAHLGDGNVHYSLYPTRNDPDTIGALRRAIDDTAVALGGSFSAEHGISLLKLGALRRLKDPVAQGAMRAVKAALDPKNILNPGKTIP